MPFRTFASKPKRAAMFAEMSGGRRIDSLCQVDFLVCRFSSQSGEHSLGSERYLMQTNTDCVVYGVGNCGNGCCEGTFTTFLGAERAFGIDALHDNRLNLRRFDR